MVSVSHGLAGIGSRFCSSTTIISISVWSICTTSSGQFTVYSLGFADVAWMMLLSPRLRPLTRASTVLTLAAIGEVGSG
jgi:hypothetical protein